MGAGIHDEHAHGVPVGVGRRGQGDRVGSVHGVVGKQVGLDDAGVPAVRAEYLEAAKAYNETDSSNVKVAIDMLHGQMTELGSGLVKMKEAIDYLQDALKNYDTADTLARMSELRKIADSLETIVTSEKWPLPKYREMLFLY